jgi:hypothetical protein
VDVFYERAGNRANAEFNRPPVAVPETVVVEAPAVEVYKCMMVNDRRGAKPLNFSVYGIYLSQAGQICACCIRWIFCASGAILGAQES